MEFHGTSSAPISRTPAVPWNSMEFHGTWSAPISMTTAVPWNSMEFHGTRSAPISITRAVPWNSMEFLGIPWNLKCANFADTSSSIEFDSIYLINKHFVAADNHNPATIHNKTTAHLNHHGIYPGSKGGMAYCDFVHLQFSFGFQFDISKQQLYCNEHEHEPLW